MPQPHPHIPQPAPAHPTESPTSFNNDSQPLPDVSVEDEGPGQLDERSLNALAAREISKQMEMSPSPLSPPSLPFAGRRSVSPRPPFASDIPPPNSGGRIPSPPPLDVPLPKSGNRFGRRIPSPPPPPQFSSPTVTHDLTPSPHPLQPPQSQLPIRPPVGGLLPARSMDSTMSDLTQPDEAYRTPPEYLRNLSTPPSPSVTPVLPPPTSQIASTLSSPSSTPATTNKISAAAFRRPRMKGPSSNVNLRDDSPRQDSLSVGFGPNPGRSPSREKGDDENGDGGPDTIVTPLNLRKKSLPAVPGISANTLSGPRSPGTPRSISSPFPNLRNNEEQPLGSGRAPPLSSTPGPHHRESMLGGGDDEFDYVSAYLNEDERRQSGMYHGATNGHGPAGGGPGASPPQNIGYGNGMFATRLED
jgi:hypothetical protein